MRAWIDFDNPPQVRYLLPVARRLEAEGFGVIIDYEFLNLLVYAGRDAPTVHGSAIGAAA